MTMQLRSRSHRMRLRPLAGVLVACAELFGVATVPLAPSVHADAVAYLVNVAVRPGHQFANAEEALGFGYAICDKVSQGRAYPQVMNDVKTDFATSDEYQASHLITHAVNELCPALIWQLRNSAAHYRPAPLPMVG